MESCIRPRVGGEGRWPGYSRKDVRHADRDRRGVPASRAGDPAEGGQRKAQPFTFWTLVLRRTQTLVDTVVFHVDALTGEDARGQSPAGDLLQGEDAISGPLVEAFLLKGDAGRTVVLLDEFLQVHLYPETSPVKEAFFKDIATSLRIPLRSGPPGQRRLTGHQVPEELEFTGRHVAYSTWSLPFPASQDILAVFARPADPVASLGKVLGNRTTLYKYLNPNLVGVLTGPPSTAPLSDKATCGVYLVDGAKGTVLYQAVLPSVSGRCDVKAALVENWLVYHYYDNDVGVNQAKGYRLVSVELYEGKGIDDKRKRYELSYSSCERWADLYVQL